MKYRNIIKNKTRFYMSIIIIALIFSNLMSIKINRDSKQDFYVGLLEKKVEIVRLEVEVDKGIKHNISLSGLNRMLLDKNSNYYDFSTGMQFDINDLRIKSNMTVGMAEDLLKGGLKGTGVAFLDAEEIYGVNARFMISTARHESGNGSYRLMSRNNIFSMNAPVGKVDDAFYYDSKRECIMDFARQISENYLNEDGVYHNGTSVESINVRYAESKLWAGKVIEIAKVR